MLNSCSGEIMLSHKSSKKDLVGLISIPWISGLALIITDLDHDLRSCVPARAILFMISESAFPFLKKR